MPLATRRASSPAAQQQPHAAAHSRAPRAPSTPRPLAAAHRHARRHAAPLPPPLPLLPQEFAGGGDLFEDLKKHGGQIKEKYVVRDVIVPFLSALAYLHDLVRGGGGNDGDGADNGGGTHRSSAWAAWAGLCALPCCLLATRVCLTPLDAWQRHQSI